ncbi:unnamed protein product, partial [Hapterophycus canaliculatus]
PKLPRPALVPSISAGGVVDSVGTTGKEGKNKSKKNKKKRARSEDEDAAGEAAGVSTLDGVAESDDDRAARVYQAWLESRFFDFLRVLLGWIAEVDDFHRQGPALRTIMQFVEIEPSLCVSAAKFSRAGRSGVGEQSSPGAGTIWGGLFAELMRAVLLGPCSMQPKLLKCLGEDFVNVHDDIRYFLLANISAAARQAMSDDNMLKEQQQRFSSSSAAASSSSKSSLAPRRLRLPPDSPLRGFQGAAAAFTDARVGNGGGKKVAAGAPASPSGTASKKRKKRKKADKVGREYETGGANGDSGLMVAEQEEEEEEGGGQRMELAEVSGRLARVLMVVRMVEEQSDLSAFLLPVRLSLPSSSPSTASRKGGNPGAGAGEGSGGDQEDLRGDASSSSDSDDDSGDEKEGVAGDASGKTRGGRKGLVNGKGRGKGKGGGAGETSGVTKRRMLAIERLRYHKK